MELRHLRCFVALAEELHFTRAAERLHIEQPPLSRAIKELEDDLGVVLFERNRRGTVLTEAGATFLQDVRRVFAVLKQAQENVRAVAAGLSGSLRIAVSDGAIDPRLSALLARCREEEPEIEIRLSEVPLADQLRGLRSGDFSIGFAHTAEVGDDIVTEPLWHDPLVVAVPARHPLLSHKAVPLHQLAIYPLVLCDPQACEGYHRELARLLRPLERPPDVAEHVSSLDMMLTLVGAGYGVGFITETRIAACLRPDVVIRPLAMDSAVITTYLLRPAGEGLPASVERFIARLRAHSDD
ncbi:LysR family transcriptional regulator [Achromobacter mucicolens]|uniref:LysR family transcriptional regulator n=1 Tax=Achromobacter mucicolens TaxID=1389922 RepID=A0ABD4YP57_9BURK|nr:MULTISPECIES: LysR family transcriptional regulator [Betaproteobacteria]MDH1177227.1 LysR family transcriptional regulator [Achromobacter mucicolens]SFW23674.1 DNA-binding transcriptional regulator, LysR family [Nitrosovibrio sp. Nv17]